MRIIVDVMGGDNAPREMVLGVLDAAAEYDENVEYTLVGDEAAIRAIAEEVEADISRFTIVPTEQVITMEDDPVCVMRAKKDSSMSTALRMLADGEGDAVVSTGNTGALFTGAMLIVRKIKHIQRAGIATILPLQNPVLLMDTGANVEVTEENLEQFARLGSAYMKTLYGLESPRVGLLNNGTEDCKGTSLQVSAYSRLAAMQDINFVGNVEGSALPFDVCDVLVTDGFTGNTANSKIENTIRKIKETQADKEYTQKVRKELEEYKKGISNKSNEQDLIERKIEKLQNRGKKKEDYSVKKEEKIVLKVGDWVKINPSSTIGEIIEISNNKACIAVGQIKTYANLKQLEKTNRKEKREIVRNSELGKKANEDIRKRKLNFKTEIDIRGMRSDEALQALTYFIDDAIMVGVGQIRVLHGTGTGALRQLTRDYAASLPEISSYHDEHVQFGGAGITIIEF